MKKLYFIESINVLSPREDVRDAQFAIVLEDVQRAMEKDALEYSDAGQNNERDHDIEVSSPYVYREFRTLPTTISSGRALYEGQYVYYDSDRGYFESAYKDPLAILRKNKNRRLRSRLIALQREDSKDESNWIENAIVTSYHVNVGNGNCTIIFARENSKYELWMVDAGAFDKKNGCNYFSNIKVCLNDIATQVNIPRENLRISKFFLTHWHYDHISGLQQLIKDGCIDSNTQCYMNLYYEHSSQYINNVLMELDKLRVKCYEPTSALHFIPYVKILYPGQRIRKRPTRKDPHCWIVKKVNNTSVVYAFKLGAKTMVLPGDIEKHGWNMMTQVRSCQLQPLCFTDYYCVSHHGSFTGHVEIPCRGKSVYNSIGECLNAYKTLKKAILMGRDGSYSGIYDGRVINYWSSILRYSEHDLNNQSCHAYVLEWGSQLERYI